MPQLITPIEGAGPPPPPRTRYDWGAHADGQFHLWRDAPAGEDPKESVAARHRLRVAAVNWAARRGGTVESRWENGGRRVWIAITLPDREQ